MSIRVASVILSLVSILTFGQIDQALAEIYQRMLLVPGNVTIAGGGGGNIPARCLDLFSKTPRRDLAFQTALVGSANTQVRVGNGAPIPMQDAINRKLVALEGDGLSHEKLRVRNLTNETLQIVTSGLTILAPDNSYPSEDLADVLPQLAQAASGDQFEIWGLRRAQSAKSYSREQLGKLGQAYLSPDNAAFYQALVKRNLVNQSTAAILLVRTDTPAGPTHALFSGKGQPVIANAFDPIGELYASALTQWKATYPQAPLTVALAARPPAGIRIEDLPEMAQRFDATYLLLAAAAAGSGGGGSGGIIVKNPASFPEPPRGWKAFTIRSEAGKDVIGPPPSPPPQQLGGGGGGGGGFAMLATMDRGGPYEYAEKFQRGEAHAYARQAPVITSMGASIHRVVTSDALETLSKEELLTSLETSVRSDLDKLYRLNPVLQQVEKGGRPGAFLEATVDGAAGKFQMAIIEMPSGAIRVVVNDESGPR